jgi:MoaA/NifB/PqqE/SkfB family radical SAM enzyme
MLPPNISIYPTYRCQLSCKHCFLTQSGKLNQFELDFETIKSIILDAKKHNVFTIVLSGGDPLLYPHIYEVLALMQKLRIVPLMGVTGLDLSLEQINKLKSLGVSSLQVSLDGPNEEVNSYYRGSNVYESVIRSIKTIQTSGIKATLAICVDKYNFRQIEDTLQLASNLDVFKVKVAFWTPVDSYDLDNRELNESEKHWLTEVCSEFNRRKQKSWISIPGSSLNKDNEPYKQKYPPCIVGADGLVRLGEGGKSIGNVFQDSISSLYGQFVEHAKHNFIEHLILNLCQSYEISRVQSVSEEQLASAALIYRLDGKLYILYRENLPIAVRLFVIVHEIGHSVRGSISYNQHIKHDVEEEKAVNLWALNFLKPYVTEQFYNHSVSLLTRDEGSFFQYLNDALIDSMVNYWS